MKIVFPWKRKYLPNHKYVMDSIGNVIHTRGLPTQIIAYHHGQEREMIVTGAGHYKAGQYIDDPHNGLLRGVVEYVRPHGYGQHTYLEDVWIYKPWLDN